MERRALRGMITLEGGSPSTRDESGELKVLLRKELEEE